jgi:DNA-binding CsgD family transcriptional regulator
MVVPCPGGTLEVIMQPRFSDALSARERQLVNKLLEGSSVKGIATELNISVNTVKDYLKTVYHKADVHSARQLIVKMRNERQQGGDSALLLEGIEDLLAARSAADIVDRLLEVASRLTESTASFWVPAQERGENLLISYPRGDRRAPLANFAQTVLRAGHALLAAGGTDDPETRRAWSTTREIAGFRVAAHRHSGLLVLSDPASPYGFRPLTLAVGRALTRIAEAKLDAREQAMATAAVPSSN